MDIATLLGLAGAFGLIIWSMLQGGTLAAYTNIPGLAIVLGGSIMVVLLRSSLQGVYKRRQGRRQGLRQGPGEARRVNFSACRIRFNCEKGWDDCA